MADAEAIRFTSRRRTGVGTTFECDTRVGPLTLTDVMEVTSWVGRREMGVRPHRRGHRHRPVHAAAGPRRADPLHVGGAAHLPWWLGGRLGGVVGARSWRGIWRGNLRRLAAGFAR
jgi:hypothetical protein